MRPERSVLVQIVHGDIETEDEQRAIEQVRSAASPWWQATHGTNDTTVYRIQASGLKPVLAVIDLVRHRWWLVTVTEQVNGR